MLLFSTILKTTERLTKDGFIKLLFRDIRENPYEENRIEDLEWRKERESLYGDEKLWLKAIDYTEKNTVAIRYEKKTDDGVVWDTDYVLNLDESKLAIQLNRSFSEDAIGQNHIFSTPYFIKRLIEENMLEESDGFSFEITANIIDDSNRKPVNTVKRGERTLGVPIVIVSINNDRDNFDDINYLAHSSKGVAHVFIKINPKKEDEKAKADELEIVYPNNALEAKRIKLPKAGINDDLRVTVLNDILKYTNSQRVDEMLTWHGINNAILLDSISRQKKEVEESKAAQKRAEDERANLKDSMDEELAKKKEEAEKEARDSVAELLDSVDDDLRQMEKKLQEQLEENNNLRAENQGLMAKLSARGTKPLLYEGKEIEFYPNEIREIVLDVLNNALRNSATEKSRREDVLKDILDNNEYEGLAKKRAEEVDRIISSYSRMEGPVRQALTDLGFEISDDGKHYKLVYYGDDRYIAMLSKTPSDKRGSKNAAAEIKNKML